MFKAYKKANYKALLNEITELLCSTSPDENTQSVKNVN